MQLKEHYQTAYNIYQWGFSGSDIAANKSARETELAMTEPLVDRQTVRRWKKLLDEGNPELYREITRFWQQLDPTPGTRYNERLLEHWERIAYAREHFTVNDNSPYGTDDRGSRWVQYGKPDRTHDGSLQLNPARVAWFIEKQEPLLVKVQQNELRNASVSLHENSRYEIWIYEEPNEDMEFNLVLIFGDGSSGGFGELETFDDFIPARAFSFSNRYKMPQIQNDSCLLCYHRPKMTPGMILQYFYYEQLAAKDFYFSHVFDRMATEWIGDNRSSEALALNRSAGHVMKQRTHMATLQNLSRSPVQTSTYAEEFPEIPLDLYQYRFLNDNGRTFMATFVESNAQQIFVEDLAANEDSMFSDEAVSVAEAFGNYELHHGIQLKDGDGEQLLQNRMKVDFLIDSSGTVPSSSVFTVPHISEETTQIFYAELKNMHPKSAPRILSPFPDELRGVGKVEINQPTPLNADPDVLEMGDIVLGYQMQDRDREGVFYPFVVANDRRIPPDQELAIHFEVYHLQPADNGLANFQLHYEILPANRQDWSAREREQSSLTLNFEKAETSYKEDLSIRAVHLDQGEYLLRVEITDQESGRQVSREVGFQVTNP